MGDAPPDLPGTLEEQARNPDTALAAYQLAVETFFGLHDPRFVGIAPPPAGGFGWNKVKLLQDSTIATADIHYLRTGTVSGTVLDGSGVEAGALVRIKAWGVGGTGAPILKELARLKTEAGDGRFIFPGVLVGDLATFQATGIPAGDFTVDAASPFSPVIVSHFGTLNANNPNQSGIVLRFPSTTETNGTISGTVVMPDGVTPAPEGTNVHISYGDLTLRTDAAGRFSSQLPLPSGNYSVTAEDPVSGLSGLSHAFVPAGGHVDLQVRILGLGVVSVVVKRPDGSIVGNADVTLAGGTFRYDKATALTNASGFVRFTNITEGPFGVQAVERETGLSGRASGVVVRDDEVSLVVTIAPAGTVTGTFVGPDGRTPIANANVVIASGAVNTYTTTDALGRFDGESIPIGTVNVSAIDPLTGRAGRSSGTLGFQGDFIDLTLVQVPRGTVEGRVVEADGFTPVAGAHIIMNGFAATTRNDGSYRFEGISAGPVAIVARDPISGATGSATTTIEFENETVELQLSVAVALDPVGTIHATILDEHGNAAGNAVVGLLGAGVPAENLSRVTDVNGSVTFERVKLGRYRLMARSLAASHNGEVVDVSLDTANVTVESTMQLRGVGTVDVIVVRSDGVTRVGGAMVGLAARAASGDELPRPFGGGFTAFSGPDGVARFVGVPVGDFHTSASLGPLAGSIGDRVSAPDAAVTTTVTLGPSATITGRVLLPDGMTAATNAVVTLTFMPQGAAVAARYQLTTPVDGTFAFAGIPLGQFALAAFEPFSAGVRYVTGTLTIDGEQHGVGDLVLDNTSPRVVSVSPTDRATSVPPDATITLTFSERMDSSSGEFSTFDPVQPDRPVNFIVTHNGERVEGSLALSSDRMAVRFTPAAPFESSGVYTVVLRGGSALGPRDESGLRTLDNFVSSFTAADTLPPSLLSISPTVDERDVLPEAVIRVTFSEAVAPGLSLVLTDGTGAPVAGRTSLSIGNTVAIFTSVDFLRPNSTYTITLTNVDDTAGNPLAGTPLVQKFFTVDTLAPAVSALEIGAGTAIGGGSVSIRPTFDGEDIAGVEDIVPGAPSRVVTAAPFSSTFSLPAGVSTYAIQAIAIDRSGNRSDATTLNIPVALNQPPAVTLIRQDKGTGPVPQGTSIAFDVAASDDVALSQVVLSAVGGAQYSSTHQVASGATQFSSTFSVVLPDNAPSNGTVTVQAAAVDSIGNRSAPSTIAISIRDAIRPTAAFSSPVENAIVLAGQPLGASLTASDDVGVVSLSLSCVPFVAGCAASPLPSPAASTTQQVLLDVPASAAGLTITLTLVATDAAGNVSIPATRAVRVVDTTAPTITLLQLVGGGGQVAAGQQAVVRAQATDTAGVAAFLFSVDGAVTGSETIVVSPATNASADFAFTIPASTTVGAPLTVRVIARDTSGNSSAQATLALTVTAANIPPVANAGPDQAVALGSRVQLNGTASTDAQNEALTYRWSFATRPAGSAATLDLANSPTPAFTADRPGAYMLELVVNDGRDDSQTDTVVVTTLNTRPVASAGPDQTAPVGATVTLDGAGSTDADGDALTYLWSVQSRPAGSNAQLANATAVSPTLTIDAPGSYAVQLVVNDGKVDSVADTVLISTVNSPPVANAGPDQSALVGDTVTVSGAASTDVDGNPLTFAWTFIARPAGSTTAISDLSAVAPSFVVDRTGTYRLGLVVNDGVVNSEADIVVITTQNSSPIANAGTDQSVFVTDTVTLDGSGSTDVNGDTLTYSWSLTTKPDGSTALLSDPAAIAPTFVVDRPGTYVAQLIVNDGVASSAPDTVTITTLNTAPVANAGPDQSVVAGQVVLLNGTASADVDGQPLTFQWTFTVRPAGSTATLTGASSAGASFIADQPGTYIVQLIVNDGVVNSAPDTMTVSTTNTTPIANAGADQLDVLVGSLVTLNGFASADADGQALFYSWSLIARPPGSTASLTDASTPGPTFTPDVPGDYVAQLIVTDGFVDSAPDTVLIRSVATERPIVVIQAADSVASEVGPDPATFIVARSGATSLPLTINLSRAGTATAGVDYVDFPLLVTIPSGQASVPITIAPLSDAISEGPESVILTLVEDAAYASGSPASAAVTITDEQSAVIVATDGSATEGGDTATFTVSRAIATAMTRDVTVTITGGTATLAFDYNFFNNSAIVASFPNSFVVRIPAGQISATFTMTAVSDVVLEPAETVVVSAEGTSATATIVDVPPPLVSITATDATAYEAGQDRAAFTIARTGSIALPLDVTVAVIGGTATLGADYDFFDNGAIVQHLPTSVVARIPAGASMVSFVMTPVVDAIVEPFETLTLSVAGGAGYAVGVPSTAVATIEDTPTAATLVDFEDLPDNMAVGTPLPSPYRGITWINWATYAPVSPSFYLPRGVNAPYALVDGARFSFSPRVFLGAWFGRCSCGLNGAVYFELYRAGALVATSPVLPDNPTPGVTPPATFLPSNYAGLVDEVRVRSLGSSMTTVGSGWFMDDVMFGPTDPNLPSVSLSATDNAASDVSIDPGTFTIARTGDTSLALTVNLIRSGTATAGTDYQAFPLFITIAPGQASATIAVVPIADGIAEGPETVVLAIAPSALYYGGTSTSDTVIIVDSGLSASLLIDFEDQPDSIPGPPAQPFPSSYRGITWNNWQHYSPAPSQVVAHGVNFIYAKVDGASFTFPGRVFLGASFSRTMGFPGNIYFELYLDGALVATSPVLADVAPQLTFLPSGYGGFVDEVRVRSLGSTIVPNGSVWIMDDVVFGALDVSRPIVSIAATDSVASEVQADTGTFTITRTGEFASPLVVNLALSGTAITGSDFAPVAAQVTIPAGQSATTVLITPLADQLFESPETVTLAISPLPGYYRGTGAATVTIADDTSFGTIVDFEDQPDSIPVGTSFPTSYQGITWVNWQHYAPYPPLYQAHGANSIFPRGDGASFLFSERVFLGAWFTRDPGHPGDVYFEMYRGGVRVATSGMLSNTTGSFLSSGFAGLVDEVRVRCPGSACIPGSSSYWVMDDVTFGALSSALACMAPPSGIVSLWAADGSTADAFARNQPSATQVTFTQGRIAQGFTFGSNGFVDIPHSTSLGSQQFTVAAWVRPDGAGPNNDDFGNEIINNVVSGTNVPIAILWRASDSRFVFLFGDIFSERIISEHVFAPGQFRFVTATYDGAVFRLFVDGVLEGSQTLAKTVQYGPLWSVGASPPAFRNGFARTWNGVIDEVFVVDRALQPSEIQSIALSSGGVCRP